MRCAKIHCQGWRTDESAVPGAREERRILMKKRALLLTACILAASAAVPGIACAEESARDTLNVIASDDASQFDPNIANTYSDIMSLYQIYERLVYYIDGEPVGQLAESWEVSDDKLTYTFHLRPDTYFHNGEKLTAEDVVYSFNRRFEHSPSTGSKFESVTAIDDDTVELKLTRVCDSIYSTLATPGMGIVCKSYCEENGDDAFLQPNGTGAYKLKEWIKGSQIQFEAFDNYGGGEVPIEYLNFNIITDSSTALISMENGENDFMINMSASDLPLVEGNDEFTIQTSDSHSMASLILNVRDGVTADESVRQAIAYAIDRDSVNIVGFDGTASIATGCYNDFLYYDGSDCTYSYDPQKAKEILAEAGYSDGDITVTIKTSENYGTMVPQVIQQNLADIGITVNIESMDIGAQSEDWLNGNFEIIYQAGSEIVPDLSEMLYSAYYTGNVWSASVWEDGRYDEQLDAIMAELDTDKRTELCSGLLKEIVATANEIPLVVKSSNIVYRTGLQNTYVDPNGMFYCFKDFSWE